VVHHVPLVSLWSSLALHTLNPSLPYCGQLHYGLRSQSHFNDKSKRQQHEKEVIYTEGTIDQRTIKGGAVALQPCPLLSEWGIQQLYCFWNNYAKR
jgi:hypothetical protein